MGLDVYANATIYDSESEDVATPESLHFSYGGYFNFRVEILEQIDPEWARIFSKLGSFDPVSDDEWLKLRLFGEQYPGIAVFVNHSDCDGFFLPEECKEIYEALKDVKLPDTAGWHKEELPKWIKVFKWAADNNLCLIYC